MSRRAELVALAVADAITLNLAFLVYYMARFRWGWIDDPVTHPPYVLLPMLFICAFWLVLFVFSGMYRERFAASRFDEIVSLFKVGTVGILILFFLIFIDDLNVGSARSNIFFYWASVISFVALGRIAVRSLQKALILRGKGIHKALIVGWSDRVEQLYDEVKRYPAAGLDVVGVIRMRPDDEHVPVSSAGQPLVRSNGGNGAYAAVARPGLDVEDRSIDALPDLIDKYDVKDVLIALGPEDRSYLIEVLRKCEGRPVSLKLVPDFYTVIGGLARTEHMYGLPLIEVLPEPMPAWEQSTKRLLDVAVATVVLLAGFPLWVLLGLMVKASSSGPAIYRQTRVGQHGKPFTMLKFRTMRNDAEQMTGPVWAQKDDPRYTPLGRWLRKTRLDEVPQLWNVLKGEMSLVGPRPERPYFVDKLAAEIPLYHRRQRVKPGITGMAQVKWKYDTSLDDVRQKVKYDLFYIENMNLRMDFKIMFTTIRTFVTGKGQ